MWPHLKGGAILSDPSTYHPPQGGEVYLLANSTREILTNIYLQNLEQGPMPDSNEMLKELCKRMRGVTGHNNRKNMKDYWKEAARQMHGLKRPSSLFTSTADGLCTDQFRHHQP